MKKMIITVLCGLLLLSGCANAQISNNDTGASAASSEKEATTYESQIKKEECALCKQQGNTILPAYAGQKNLGIICINTFDISPIEINRYDDFGNLIEKPSETFSIMHNGFGEENMNTHVTPNPDRGYANVDVSFTKDETVDKSAIESLLCSDCISSIMTKTWDEPYGVGVIDFDTLEVRLFEEKITGFTFGDYYIEIDHTEKQNDSDPTELDLLIFYCPPRYE